MLTRDELQAFIDLHGVPLHAFRAAAEQVFEARFGGSTPVAIDLRYGDPIAAMESRAVEAARRLAATRARASARASARARRVAGQARRASELKARWAAVHGMPDANDPPPQTKLRRRS